MLQYRKVLIPRIFKPGRGGGVLNRFDLSDRATLHIWWEGTMF
jgi:hypothetical protein